MQMQPIFKKYDYIQIEKESVSEDIYKRGVCLPSDTKMTKEEQDKVIEVIKGLF